MILLIDNYDSFVHNLARYFQRLGQPTHVVRNDVIDAAGVAALEPAAIVLSPGPCTPAEAGVSVDAVGAFARAGTPVLGVCLGHQALVEAFGGRTIQGDPVHGKDAEVEHDGRTIYAGLPTPLVAGRYHSLVADPQLPDELEVSATFEDVVMGVRHRELPAEGVQFHPESVLTPHGKSMLATFLED